MAPAFYVARPARAGSDRLYAVRLLADRATPPAHRESILAEAHAASLFEHPQVLKIQDVIVEESGEIYVATEFLAGESLAQLLRSAGELTRQLSAVIARDLAVILHDAHTAKDRHGLPLRLVHGDLSPTTVMLSHEGGLHLVDFGLPAASWRGAPARQMVYWPPERALGVLDLEPRSDVYALGVILYEMLTGEEPREEDAPDIPRGWRPLALATPSLRKCGRDLESIVRSATAPNKSERYLTALQMAEVLDVYVRARAPHLDGKNELGRLMAKHFAHRARATRTLLNRWNQTTGARSLRPTRTPVPVPPAPPAWAAEARPLAESLTLDLQAPTDDMDRAPTGDLPPARARVRARDVVLTLLLVLVAMGALVLAYARGWL